MSGKVRGRSSDGSNFTIIDGVMSERYESVSRLHKTVCLLCLSVQEPHT